MSRKRAVSAHLSRHWRNHTIEAQRLIRAGLLPSPIIGDGVDAEPQPPEAAGPPPALIPSTPWIPPWPTVPRAAKPTDQKAK